MPTKSVNVAEYLYTRLRQLGCKALHGLPGDYNLLALDFVEPSGLTWIGNCNELNAGYAADAYARVTGLGAIMTTFGVGELSAVNAIAGSYAEMVPVVHIVGTPPRNAQEQKMDLHHTLGNGDYRIYSRIFSEVTIAQADLLDAQTAPSEIDKVLRDCVVHARPVYIELPTSTVAQPVDARLLETPIDVSPVQGDAALEEKAVDEILEHLYAAKRPSILVDAGVVRRRIETDMDSFIRKTGIATYVAPMGKGGVNESLPNFCGVYAGAGTDFEIKEAFEASDFVLMIGSVESDLNTTGFTTKFPESTVALEYDYCTISGKRFDEARFKTLLPKLTEAVDPDKIVARTDVKHSAATEQIDTDTITHSWLWPRMSSFFQTGDIIVCDTGTSYVGIWASKLPDCARSINQILWSSIGYATGAAQGAAQAAKEAGKGQRTICFEGDGSFHLTAQEISTMIRHNHDVTFFLIENSGYTIERFVHGLDADYNDIPQWRYAQLPQVLTPPGSKARVKSWRIESRAEFDRLLSDQDFIHGKGLQFVEFHMPKKDAPQMLIDFGESSGKKTS